MRERLEKEEIVRMLEEAMLECSREHFGGERSFEATYDEQLSAVEVYEWREVVARPSGPHEIPLEEARALDPTVELGDELGTLVDTRPFQRTAAMRAKQRILARLGADPDEPS